MMDTIYNPPFWEEYRTRCALPRKKSSARWSVLRLLTARRMQSGWQTIRCMACQVPSGHVISVELSVLQKGFALGCFQSTQITAFIPRLHLEAIRKAEWDAKWGCMRCSCILRSKACSFRRNSRRGTSYSNEARESNRSFPWLHFHLILSITTTAIMNVAKQAAQKLIQPPVPPAIIRHIKLNAIKAAIATTNVKSRSRFLLSGSAGYTLSAGPLPNGCS